MRGILLCLLALSQTGTLVAPLRAWRNWQNEQDVGAKTRVVRKSFAINPTSEKSMKLTLAVVCVRWRKLSIPEAFQTLLVAGSTANHETILRQCLRHT